MQYRFSLTREENFDLQTLQQQEQEREQERVQDQGLMETVPQRRSAANNQQSQDHLPTQQRRKTVLSNRVLAPRTFANAELLVNQVSERVARQIGGDQARCSVQFASAVQSWL